MCYHFKMYIEKVPGSKYSKMLNGFINSGNIIRN